MNATDTRTEAVSHPTTSSDTSSSDTSGRPPLRRAVTGRLVAGVASGVADYLGVDATILRIVLAVLTVMGGAGIPLYLAGWLLIPEEGSDQSLASEILQPRSTREH